MEISKVLDENIKYIEGLYENCADVIRRKFPVGKNKDIFVYVVYIDNMTDNIILESSIMRGLMLSMRIAPPPITSIQAQIFDALRDGGITSPDVREVTDFDDFNVSMMSGDTIIFIDGFDKALLVATTRGFPNRGVPTVDTEIVVQGSKEAFSEVMRVNTVLIRRRIRDTKLKVEQLRVGRRSKTDIAIMYLDDVVRKDILDEAMKRIKRIDIDAILDVGYIQQLIEEDWSSPLPQGQLTERPDKAASAILEGRIVIVVDNSPFVLIVPCTFNCFFQASEDYYQRWEIMSFTRALRYIAGLISIILPGLYLATAIYHPSMIPSELMFRMAASRENVPFPALVEILIMDVAFELLREAGIRLPVAIGGAMGIVGGIIIGQAVVEAGIVSPIVVIIVALTAICGFSVPNVSLISGFRLMKYFVIFMSAFLGLFGFWISCLFILAHVSSLKSFGIPYMYPFVSSGIDGNTDIKDTFIRVPLFKMKKRPIFAKQEERDRYKSKEMENEMREE